MARVQKAKSTVENGLITFSFEGHEPIAVDFNSLSDEIKYNLGLHGLK